MSTESVSEKPKRVAVIVSESQHYIYGNGEVERHVKLFDLPPEIAAYIRSCRRNQYASVSLALEDESDG